MYFKCISESSKSKISIVDIYQNHREKYWPIVERQIR